MKVLHPKIWVITPKNEGFGFPWSIIHSLALFSTRRVTSAVGTSLSTTGGTASAGGSAGTVGTVGGAVGAWRSGKHVENVENSQNEKQQITIVAWWNVLGNKLWTYQFEETFWQKKKIYIYIYTSTLKGVSIRSQKLCYLRGAFLTPLSGTSIYHPKYDESNELC